MSAHHCDLEADLIVVKAHKSALLVITDLATLLNRLKKATSRQATLIELAIELNLARFPKSFVITMTFDKAIANHQ